MSRAFFLIFLLLPFFVHAQLNNHWSYNFNDESSLLAGAVVGGGAGASSIFFNPATISEITQSKLSLNASLFSFDFLNASNAWGQGLDYKDSRSYVTPRFLSYMLKPRRSTNWSFEVAFMNISNIESENIVYVDENINILQHVEGVERYTASGQIKNQKRDDWIGFGGSYQINESWSFGTSIFVSILSMSDSYNLQLDARPQTDINNEDINHISSYNEQEILKFSDYRLLWKLGVVHLQERFSLGLNVTLPAVSGIYSDGKRTLRRRSQNNIYNPGTGDPVTDYLIQDYAEKNDMIVRTKTPLSISVGANFYNTTRTSTFFTTIEYFTKIQPYTMSTAEKTPGTNAYSILTEDENNQWLSFVDGARTVVNVAIGYRWNIKENFIVLAGFKTDFNYMKDYDLQPFLAEFTIKNLNFNKYHFTGGSTLHVFGQDITAGLQYTFGWQKDQKQIANLSDPVEYNTVENKPLQGTRMNIMNTLYNSVSIYIAATLNFKTSEKGKKE